MDNCTNLELIKEQERLLKFLGKTVQSRDSDLQRRLSTINETNQSIDIEDESSTGIQKNPNIKIPIQDENDMEFVQEPKDALLKKIESIALSLDTHGLGVLLVKETVYILLILI